MSDVAGTVLAVVETAVVGSTVAAMGSMTMYAGGQIVEVADRFWESVTPTQGDDAAPGTADHWQAGRHRDASPA